MVEYAVVKLIHQSAVTLSFAGFFARGIGSLAGAAWVRSRAALALPQVIDSVLLLSALTLAWLLRANPLTTPWLLAKIGALVIYIGLGTLALRAGLPRGLRAAAWLLALATFGFIVSVAITKRPVGYFGWL